MKKQFLIGLFLLVLFSNSYSNNMAQEWEFIGFSHDKRWGFFRGLSVNNFSVPLSYMIYDMRKNKIANLYRTPEDIRIWKQYYNPSLIIPGVETRSFRGYSVVMERKTEAVNERNYPVSGSTAPAIAVFTRKTVIQHCIFYLEYHQYNAYKRLRLFEYSVSQNERPASLRYRVWWDKSARAFTLIILSSDKMVSPRVVKSFVYGLSW